MQKLKFLFFLLICFQLKAQLPETDLWLVKLDAKDRSKIIETLNITNRPGYDNQPSFSADGKQIYFTSIHEDKQADIYAYQLKSKKIVQLTHTKESEYSPYEAPINKVLSVVTVLQDSSQVIQLLDQKTYTVIPHVISKTDSIGYYHFLNADTVLYYKLTDPHSLRFLVLSNGNDEFIAEHPCRTFKKTNRSSFLFGIKDSVSTTYFLYQSTLYKAIKYAQLKSVNEDIIWHDTLGLLVSDGARILQFDQTKNVWNVLYDLTDKGIKKITRFCFDPKTNYLVVVNNL